MVVVNYKKYDLTRTFFDSFYAFQPSVDYTLTMFDNESIREESEIFLDELPQEVRLLRSDKNLGYARACNIGANIGDGDYIGLFNNDIRFVNNATIDRCVEFMDENPEVGIVGPFQYTIDKGVRKVTNAGILGPGSTPKHRGWMEVDKDQYRFNEEVLMIMGSAMIIRRQFWNKMRKDEVFTRFFPNAVGAMPHTPLYYEDTTLCYAAPYFGYKVFYLGEPGCELIHTWHQTIKDNPSADKHFHTSREIFRKLMDEWNIEHD
jgi:GT2 family glycosyltransferase